MKKLDLKAMVTCAALIAAAIVLSRFLSINAWNLKIGFTFVPVFSQSILTFIYFKDHISASSAVPAVWTTIGYIQLSAEAYMSVSAFS